MDTAGLLALAQRNCVVNSTMEAAVQVFSLRVENGSAPQAHPEYNTDFDTDRSSELASFVLPVPQGDFMAIYQHKSWWIRPAFLSCPQEVPDRTQLLLWKEGEEFSALLAVCDGLIRTDFCGCEAGISVSVSTNGCPLDSEPHVSVCYMRGNDPYLCIREMVKTACTLQGRPHILRENKRFPEMFRGLGWCTWDSFYHKVNEKDIIRKLAEFREKSIPIHWMLIDDGWSDADYTTRKLNDLTADQVKFPNGLAHCVSTAKEEFGIAKVGVWHALMGYWTGFNPGSAAFREWENHLIQKNGTDYVLEPKEDVILSFYHRWHSWLRDCGIDFVKVDGQGSGSIYYKEQSSYTESAGSYLRALERSTEKHFNSNLINCMGMAPENMWLREHSTLSRSSDDFVPEVEHGFREHAMQNSFNSLLQGQFFWGDWDMFWSDHVENRQNSALRCVGGGPVYVSDQLDRTEPTYILPLLGWDNKVILCDQIGVPTTDCLLRDPLSSEGLLKIFNRYGAGYTIAVLNIHKQENRCRDLLTTKDIPELAGGRWLVYSHFAGKCQELRDDLPVSLELDANDAEVLIVLPKQEHGQFLGDPAKYISHYALVEEAADAHCLRGTLQPVERVAFVADGEVSQVRLNGREVPFKKQDGYYEISCGTEHNAVIEVYY